MRIRSLVAAALIITAPATDLRAQERTILSPRDSVFLTLDTNKIGVNYGRPSIRGRKIMGQLVPWNTVWRTGANQATHFTTSMDIAFGTVPVPRGTYTLWTIPGPDTWKIIVNRQTGQWGTQYDPSQDLARFDASPRTSLAVTDTFTISLTAASRTSGVMTLAWENTVVSIPFEKNDRIRPLSPLDSTMVAVNGGIVSIVYSRPYARGRNVWGTVVPLDSVWRTGANLTTSLTTDVDLTVGGMRIPKGSYSLFSIPTDESLTLIVSRKPGRVMPRYEPKDDLVRIDMKREKTTTWIDPFTIRLLPSGNGTATLRIGWADRVFTVPVLAQ